MKQLIILELVSQRFHAYQQNTDFQKSGRPKMLDEEDEDTVKKLVKENKYITSFEVAA